MANPTDSQMKLRKDHKVVIVLAISKGSAPGGTQSEFDCRLQYGKYLGMGTRLPTTFVAIQ
jgi:hypothetical protein